MHHTHWHLTKCAIYDYGKCDADKSRIAWIQSCMSMAGLAANTVWFTAEMEETFQLIQNGQKDAMQEFFERQNIRINDLVTKGVEN